MCWLSQTRRDQISLADSLAGAYGTGQDRQPGLQWQYAQRRGKPRVYAVHICFEENEL